MFREDVLFFLLKKIFIKESSIFSCVNTCVLIIMLNKNHKFLKLFNVHSALIKKTRERLNTRFM